MNIQGMDFSGLKLFYQIEPKTGKDLDEELEFGNSFIGLGREDTAARSLGPP